MYLDTREDDVSRY